MKKPLDLISGLPMPDVAAGTQGNSNVSQFAKIEFLRRRSVFDPFTVLVDVVAAFRSLIERRCTPIRLHRSPFAPEYVTGSDYILALALGHVLDTTLSRLKNVPLTAEIQTIDGKGHLAFSLLEDDGKISKPAPCSHTNPWNDIAHHIRRVEYLSFSVSTARNGTSSPFGIRLEI